MLGFVAGAALIAGAAVAYFCRVPQRLIAAVSAFGAGVLISALSFELPATPCSSTCPQP
jgi:ZIP family zinc transporter